jgi:hypothetical protein
MKTPLNVKHWPVPSTIGTATAEDDLSTMMALEIQKEIDMVL